MRVLMTSFAHATHYFHLVPLAWALRAAGHEVRVASQPSLTDTITGSGLTAEPVGDDSAILELLTAIGGDPTPYQTGLDFAETRDAPLSWTHALGQQTIMSALCFAPLNGDPTIDDMVELVRDWEPDLVIWEPFTYAGAIAAVAGNVPHARLLWGPDVVLNARQQFLRLLERQPPAQREDPLGEWVGWTLDRLGIDPTPAAVEEVLQGRCTVDVAPAELRLSTRGRVLSMRYVPYNGPSVLPRWLRDRPERPRVCFTLGVSVRGTAGADTVSSDLLDALGELDVEVIATLDTSQLEGLRLPDNVRAVDFVPMDALLPTCSAIVHHGGAGTTYTSSVHGVPQIVVASLWDGPLRARLLEEFGAGLAIAPEQLTADSVASAVLRAIEEPALVKGAERLRREMLAMPSPAQVVPELERFARS